MTTLDDLARVERELREYVSILESHLYNQPDRASWVENKADTIAAYIAAQRERDADNAKLRAELAAAKAEVEQSDAEYQDAVTLAKSNLDRFQAAQAECAQMREALLRTQSALREVGNDYPGSSCFTWCHARADEADAALSTDAGRNYVGASGAVEGKVEVTTYQGEDLDGNPLPDEFYVICPVPSSWAGKPVLIVPKPEGWK